ncbi:MULTISPECIES: amino acid ABC transporter ATP-binding protein [unclassified Rhizobium]|uniref:amino acid ABC transporter ATP-binding protein n=1 Tax=unclassified Rhizobium TaxID=2613769 RepID=UPI00160E7367|nr:MULTISPECIES: amino acid ABC transporter ATP-binding protein [unclassified Rhizobium]MBB3289110.1 polar amino acid transport system ATP-binding protein [Rhizobium sp. BK252]MBB3403852.1 polar amino acid transport system ATP-binding protein [Rhizobium sp. BK289]MBB3416479.1 polar amino acid transport system ATP-binding protein [Rhizobium sp. BK284]MBB3484315.1 polar amino acid transport system ATP-binding protein [Rhizobium sp. BK347]
MNEKPVVEAFGVEKRYGNHEILRGIDFVAKRGEVTCILGPSGGGKSTFLRCINHLETIDGGELFVNGQLVGYRESAGKLYEISERETAERRSQIGMVFQQFNLFAHLSILDNVVQPQVVVKRRPAREAREKARALLSRVGLADKGSAYPRELSGGQQQRAAIARTLAMDPQLILFDEPTSALDPELVSEVLDVMRDLAKGGMTMIAVTHEIGFAREVADQIAFFDGGRLVELAPPVQFLKSPSTERAQNFLRKVLL